MSAFTPTPEQLAIVEAVGKGEDNLIVVAGAGAAKTSTLVLAAEKAPGPLLVLAFNKAIQKEMEDRMPAGVTSLTLHSCGYRAFAQYLGKKCKPNFNKLSPLWREIVQGLGKKDADDAWESWRDVKKAVSMAKNQGILFRHSDQFTPLASPEEFFEAYPVRLTSFERDLVEQLSNMSWQETLAGTLDGDDMVLAPAVARVTFPYFRTVFVDEAQDLSSINHVLLSKLTRSSRTRLVAVGDPLQAIYGFRGAHTNSMHELQAQYGAKALSLTTTFRCAKEIVKVANNHAPDLRPADWAPEGEVKFLESWGPEDIPADDVAIVCRNNAPLFSMAMRLLVAGRSCEIPGRDITAQIVKFLEELQPKRQPPLSREHTLYALSGWVKSRKLRIKDHSLVDDQAACLRIFIDATENLAEAIEKAKEIAEMEGRVKLMTGHRAKGLEFKTVIILDRFLLRPDPESQDDNLLYVMQTRAKESLYYATSENFSIDLPEPADEMED